MAIAVLRHAYSLCGTPDRFRISSVIVLTNDSTGTAPASPCSLDLTETLCEFDSLSPTTSIYGTFSNCASRILYPSFSFLSSTLHLTPAAVSSRATE